MCRKWEFITAEVLVRALKGNKLGKELQPGETFVVCDWQHHYHKNIYKIFLISLLILLARYLVCHDGLCNSSLKYKWMECKSSPLPPDSCPILDPPCLLICVHYGFFLYRVGASSHSCCTQIFLDFI